LRLDDFVLYLDENLDNCKPIMDALIANSVRFERHRDHFDPGTLDEDWLSFVGRSGWIVLTKDKHNRYNQWEKTAIRRHQVREFYFASGNINAAEMAQALIAALPELRNLTRALEPPFVISITKSGNVTVVFDREGATHLRRHAKRRARQ
jgi:PIN domain-containing protein